MPGEAMHQKGAQGAQRAKRWLDSTARTRSSWTNEDEVPAGRLEFRWPHEGQQPFSFDIGGELYGDPYDHHFFAAEVKNYSGDALGGHYDDYLAKCYLVFRDYSNWVNQFMFLTWHPFRVTSWTKQCDPEAIVAGCLRNKKRLFNEDEDELALAKIDTNLVEELKDRLWLIILSEKQEQLLMSDDDRARLFKWRVRKGLI